MKFFRTKIISNITKRLQIDYYVPIEQQLIRIFKSNPNLYNFNNLNRDENIIKDVYDGKIYKDFLKNQTDVVQDSKYFTLLFNTDGIEISRRSDVSIWPMIFVLNELPIEIRFCFENIIIAGNYKF